MISKNRHQYRIPSTQYRIPILGIPQFTNTHLDRVLQMGYLVKFTFLLGP
ncbi:hypothetical protein D1AOALGA4SA_10326 [Olavius algarvensis Delta 1 endosymbiont]|nr:hypothetical protein D1AOALGA4SA_10326 [Olavius algarvensis Delta 1 endosymbiont]